MADGIKLTMQAIQNTAPKYLKGAINLTLRKRFILSYLMKAGRVLYNETGPEIIWKVKYRKPETRTANGNTDVFSSMDNKKELRIGFSHLKTPNMIDQLTLLFNKGEGQIIDLSEELVTDAVDSITESITDQLYLDNAGDTAALAGLASIFKPRVGATTDLYAIPAIGATYGGLSMELGTFGGRWSKNDAVSGYANTAMSAGSRTDFPNGQGDSQYDFMSPKMFNYTGNWSGGGTNTWRSNGEMCMRRAPSAIAALGGEGAAPAMFLMNREHYDTFRDALQDRERLTPSDYAKNLGFPGIMEYEGATLAYDYSCPSGKSYAINPQEMALCSAHSDLLYTNGPEYSIKDEAYLFRVGFVGNLRYNPKYMCEFGSYV
jgi:hypothetical protein